MIFKANQNNIWKSVGNPWEIRAHHDVLRCPSRPSGAHLLVAAAASRGQGETLRGRVELHDQFGPDQEFQHVSIRFNTFKNSTLFNDNFGMAWNQKRDQATKTWVLQLTMEAGHLMLRGFPNFVFYGRLLNE